MLYRTNLTGGGVTVFAPTVNIPAGSPSSEHYVSSSLGLGGFPSPEIYIAAASRIIHVDHAGLALAASYYQRSRYRRQQSRERRSQHSVRSDRTFGGNMLVITIGGAVYRITSTGAATVLATTSDDTEGLDVAR